MPPGSQHPASDQLGRPLHDLRISVTDRCNFRCTYCMPAEIFGDTLRVPETRNEILSSRRSSASLGSWSPFGVDKVRITGGEPLLRHDLRKLIERSDRVPPPGVDDIALTTNGTLLKRMAGHAASRRPLVA